MGKIARGLSTRTPIDFRAIAARVDLQALISADRGSPTMAGGRPRWPCPFHDDDNPSLYLFDAGKRWRCWPCQKSGNAIDWLVEREGIGPAEAARMLDPRATGPAVTKTGPRPAPAAPIKRPRTWEDPAWQDAVYELVRRAEDVLWGPSGSEARDWLEARGLAEYTIRHFRLGFLDEGVRSDPLAVLADDGGPRRIQAPRGIVIPWVRPGSWYSANPDPSKFDPRPRWVGANVRRLAADPIAPLPPGVEKCRAFRGSTRGYPYPYADLTPGVPALLCEGEFDALIAWQEAGWLVNAITVGGSGQSPRPEAQAALACCPAWLLAFDHDAAGDEASRAWWHRSPAKAKRLYLPQGKDLTDFVVAGGSMPRWLVQEAARLGLGRATTPAVDDAVVGEQARCPTPQAAS